MSKARDLANAGTALGAVDATELGYLDGVTSAVQTQIDSKIGSASAINPTIVDAKGDIIAASAADTVARLAVGANDTVLTADSTAATGLKWATPAAGGMTLLSTTTLSSTSTTVSSIDQTYQELFISVFNVAFSGGGTAILQMQVNGSATISCVSGFDAAAGASFTGVSGNVMQAGIAFPVFNIRLPQYTTADIAKLGWGSSGGGGGSNARAIFTYYGATGSAITSIKIAANGSTFSQGSVQIWGVK
jgi:hypothetical protein